MDLSIYDLPFGNHVEFCGFVSLQATFWNFHVEFCGYVNLRATFWNFHVNSVDLLIYVLCVGFVTYFDCAIFAKLYYTPSIYAEGYIIFVFLFVCSFVRNFAPFVELLQSFMLKQLKWRISHQPLIRKHSYLDHRYSGGSAFIPCLLTLGSMPQGGARGQNLGHL